MSQAKTCAVCCSNAATHFCSNDDAFLCQQCNVEIHSSNVLARSHKVVLLAELAAQDAALGRQSQSQASASNAIPEQPVVSFSHSLYSEDGQVVPTLDAPTLDALNAADFELFDLDNGWMDKFTAGNGSGGYGCGNLALDSADLSPDEAGLVPTLDPSFLQNDAAAAVVPEVPCMLMSFPSIGLDISFDVNMMMSEDENDNMDGASTRAPALHPVTFADEEAEEEEEEEECERPSKPAVRRRPSASSLVGRSGGSTFQLPAAIVKVSREQAAINRATRVALYRAKRKNRKFEKTIRYASRKAYAEVRPRIKGRFAKPGEMEAIKAAAAAAMAEDDDLLVVPCF